MVPRPGAFALCSSDPRILEKVIRIVAKIQRMTANVEKLASVQDKLIRIYQYALL